MTVYLLHFDQPLPRGVSKNGTSLYAGHYTGWTDDLVGRILEHSETTWTHARNHNHNHAHVLVGTNL